MRITTVSLIVLALAASASAQITPSTVGLQWTSQTTGVTGGVFGCGPSPFTCVIDTVNVGGGELVNLTVRGQLGGAYFLALSGGTIACTPVPGLLNQLLIDPSQLFVLTPAFFMTTADQILACPGGVGTVPVIWPAGAQGLVLYVQGLATGPAGQLAFTNAIQIVSI